jgi:hypothetical protein
MLTTVAMTTVAFSGTSLATAAFADYTPPKPPTNVKGESFHKQCANGAHVVVTANGKSCVLGNKFSRLPFTGSDAIVPGLIAGSTLAAAGAGVTIVARRRRSSAALA